MAAWFLPALKAVLPHLGTIIDVAAPVFTRRSAEATSQAQLLQQQIAELQSAATQNADSLKALARDLQQAAAIADARLRRALLLCAAALALAGVALAAALVALFAR